MTEKKYYITILRSSDEPELNDPMVYIDEFEDGYLNKTIRIYKNAETTCATWEAGYKSEWFESVKFDDDLIRETKEDSNYVFFEISKEDFEREWQRITLEAGFELVPYDKYTQADYDRRMPPSLKS